MTYLCTFCCIIQNHSASERVEQSWNKDPHSKRVIMEDRRRGRYGGQLMAIVGRWWKLLLWTEGKKKKIKSSTNPEAAAGLLVKICPGSGPWVCGRSFFLPFFSLPLPFQHLAEPLIQVNSRHFNPVTKRETKCCLNKRLWAVNARAVRKAGFDPRGVGESCTGGACGGVREGARSYRTGAGTKSIRYQLTSSG